MPRLKQSALKASKDGKAFLYKGEEFPILSQKTFATQSLDEMIETQIVDPITRWWAGKRAFALECVIVFDQTFYAAYAYWLPEGYSAVTCSSVTNAFLYNVELILPSATLEKINKAQAGEEGDVLGLKTSILILAKPETVGLYPFTAEVARVVAWARVGRPLDYDSTASNAGLALEIAGYILMFVK
ncbi:MAG: hypothetical protein HXY22_03035 [Alphaproteobacteria bacterium]|nr:hypothetical protein [Alphaproteobacteria bacterium]